MGNRSITGRKKAGYKRKASKAEILKYNTDDDKNSNNNGDIDECLHKIIEHTKNYNVENSLIIIPEKILNHPEFNLMTNEIEGTIKDINNKDVPIEDILQNYKIIHISNVEENDVHDKLTEAKLERKEVKNVLISNLLVNYDHNNYESLDKNNKILRVFRRKKRQKTTDMYLEHYCSLLKSIINNLEYKWDWHNKSLMSDLSHQLKTPLTGLLTGIQILSKSKTSKKDTVIIEHLFKSCLELSTHINNITDYYFINQNNIKLNYNIIHVENILLTVKKVYRTQLHESNNKLIYSIDDMSNKIIMQDKDRLFKVIYNLVNNSVKFTENGYVYIHVFVSNDNKRYYFRVYDTGNKVEDKDKEYLFDPFYRLDERKEHIFREGIGLGLSICKKIINAMKGSIYFADCDDIPVSNLIPHSRSKKKFVNCVEFWFPMTIGEETSENDKLDNIIDMMDTTIHTLDEFDEENSNNNMKLEEENIEQKESIKSDTIEDKNIEVINNNDLPLELKKKKKHKKRKLPLVPKSVSPIKHMMYDDVDSNASEQTIQDTNDFSDCNKILIVEDHKANSSLIKLMIRNVISSNIQVDIQNASEFAYDDISEGDYDYILLDLRMPKVSGFDILNRLKKNKYFKRKKQSKIIVITALLSNVVEDLKEKYPRIDIIYKPIDIKQLAAKLSS